MILDNHVIEKSAAPVKTTISSAVISVGQCKVKSRIQFLAEAVILQSIEDLFDSLQRRNSINFFRGEGFNVYAEIAGLSTANQIRIIRMLGNAGFKQSH